MMNDHETFVETMLENLIREIAISPEGPEVFKWLNHDIEECDLLEDDGVREKWQAFIGELLADSELNKVVDEAVEARALFVSRGRDAKSVLRKLLSRVQLPVGIQSKELTE